MWIYQTPCCCSEMGRKVGDEWRLPPNPDNGGDAPPPPPRPRPREPGELTPATVVWAWPGLEEMPSPASTETSRASLPAPEDEEPLSPLQPRVLFEDTDDSSATSEDAGHGDDDAAPGVEVRISAEGYADDTYMLAMCIMTLQLMLLATGQWVQLTGQEINVKKSMLFGVRGLRGTTAPPLRAELNGEALPVQHEFRQLGVGVRTTITKGTGPLLEARMDSAKQALRKVRTLPVGFEGRAIIVAVMVLAAVWGGAGGGRPEAHCGTGHGGHACTVGNQQAVPSQGNCVCPPGTRAPSGAEHGGAVSQDLLAGAHGAHQRDPTNHCAGSMGASYDQRGSRPNGTGPEGAQPAGMAGHLRVLAVDLPGGAGLGEHGAGVSGGGRARRQGGAAETRAPASRAPPASAFRGHRRRQSQGVDAGLPAHLHSGAGQVHLERGTDRGHMDSGPRE